MPNYYDEYKAKIKSILHEDNAEANQNKFLKEYKEVKSHIRAFYAYKSFIEKVLPIIIERYMNYELKTDVLSSDNKENFDITNEDMHFGLSLVAVDNESFKYTFNKKNKRIIY